MWASLLNESLSFQWWFQNPADLEVADLSAFNWVVYVYDFKLGALEPHGDRFALVKVMLTNMERDVVLFGHFTVAKFTPGSLTAAQRRAIDPVADYIFDNLDITMLNDMEFEARLITGFRKPKVPVVRSSWLYDCLDEAGRRLSTVLDIPRFRRDGFHLTVDAWARNMSECRVYKYTVENQKLFHDSIEGLLSSEWLRDW
jgi:hypothetical protein